MIGIKKIVSHVAILCVLTRGGWVGVASATTKEPVPKNLPNIILIFTDDQGYQDIGVFGSPNISTPHLDAMAKEGIKFKQFYVASSVCSPSRASILTGRLGHRNGVVRVLKPDSLGLPASEVTIAEMLKQKNYQTAAIGKWHLGDLPDSLPTAQGFDYYYGVPYSNDMYIGATHSFSENVKFNQQYNLEKAEADQIKVRSGNNLYKKLRPLGVMDIVPLFENEKIIEYPADQSRLTQRYFNKALGFIEANQDQPFFVYLTPNMPHTPLHVSEQFKGKSKRGLYGDVIEEIDWNVGRLRSHLDKLNLTDNTLIIYTSDNGPWLAKKEHGGSALPFKKGKTTNFEGGVRVPAVAVWPNRIKANQISTDMVSAMDLLPTFAALTDAKLPAVIIDGQNIENHLINTDVPTARTEIIYTHYDGLAGIRLNNWKYMRPGMDALWTNAPNTTWLYNLNEDPSEKNNLANKFPEKVKQLEQRLKLVEQSLTLP
ncbi:sulfatase [Paraglaciecola sp. L3A3]|uniref:sulfatase family protein n=1 Tax=Paraglaciecola sp. L3A3 TaxID=2686358 RepID=UPI00131C3F76|nr:sulfatase [Paraglaciecola sp. L3A3]